MHPVFQGQWLPPSSAPAEELRDCGGGNTVGSFRNFFNQTFAFGWFWLESRMFSVRILNHSFLVNLSNTVLQLLFFLWMSFALHSPGSVGINLYVQVPICLYKYRSIIWAGTYMFVPYRYWYACTQYMGHLLQEWHPIENLQMISSKLVQSHTPHL